MNTQPSPKHGEYGLCIQPDMDNDEFIYFFGIEVEDFNSIQSNMSTLVVSEAKYAV